MFALKRWIIVASCLFASSLTYSQPKIYRSVVTGYGLFGSKVGSLLTFTAESSTRVAANALAMNKCIEVADKCDVLNNTGAAFASTKNGLGFGVGYGNVLSGLNAREAMISCEKTLKNLKNDLHGQFAPDDGECEIVQRVTKPGYWAYALGLVSMSHEGIDWNYMGAFLSEGNDVLEDAHANAMNYCQRWRKDEDLEDMDCIPTMFSGALD